MPDPVCVRQMNTYLSLWKEDKREVMDQVIKRTEEVSCDWCRDSRAVIGWLLAGAAADEHDGAAAGEPRGVGGAAARPPADQEPPRQAHREVQDLRRDEGKVDTQFLNCTYKRNMIAQQYSYSY